MPGTTSACAENTTISALGTVYAGNYLRVRGEYAAGAAGLEAAGELPPRARRIPIANGNHLVLYGTTSACAENTISYNFSGSDDWNYLRVRGEYLSTSIDMQMGEELPPRARRIRVRGEYRGMRLGTTSACAENTHRGQKALRDTRNYLRVRGEYLAINPDADEKAELPPRARRIPLNELGLL